MAELDKQVKLPIFNCKNIGIFSREIKLQFSNMYATFFLFLGFFSFQGSALADSSEIQLFCSFHFPLSLPNLSERSYNGKISDNDSAKLLYGT